MNALIPWPTYAEPWSLAVAAITFSPLDGEPATSDAMIMGDDAIDPNRQVIQCPPTWARATLTVTGTTSQPHLVRHYDGFAVVSAANTLFRQAFRLAPDGGGGFRGELTLYRDQLAGTAKIALEITSDVHGRIRSIGHSETWRLVVDGGTRPIAPGLPPVETHWVDFSTSAAPSAARANPNAPAFLELGAAPVLYLNKGIIGLERLLYANTAQRERRLFRELVSAEIARLATSVLVHDALDQASDELDGDWEPPSNPASHNALIAVANALGVEPADLANQWADADSPAGRATLASAVEAAIGTVTGLADAIAETTRAQDV